MRRGRRIFTTRKRSDSRSPMSRAVRTIFMRGSSRRIWASTSREIRRSTSNTCRVPAGLIGILHLYEKAAQDGTEIAILPRDVAINQMLRPEQARYDARRYNWIGTISSYAGVMFVASRTGVKTAEDLRSVPVIAGSWGQTTETYITPTLLNALAGTKFKLVTGYRGGPDVDLAVERGEVDGRMSSWTLLKTQRAALAQGQIRRHPVPGRHQVASRAQGYSAGQRARDHRRGPADPRIPELRRGYRLERGGATERSRSPRRDVARCLR